jgi:hypothetical protein
VRIESVLIVFGNRNSSDDFGTVYHSKWWVDCRTK